MTELLLIRHAVNDFVKTGRLAGWTPGVHLNEHGRAQALALGERLASPPLDAAYSSPLERCMETAEAVMAHHPDLKLIPLEAVGEVRFGAWQGGELHKLSGRKLWRSVQVYPSRVQFPGGETIRQAQMRAVDALEALVERHPRERIAVFSHSDVIKLILAHYLGMHIDLFQRIDVSPASISILRLTLASRPMIVQINETTFLPDPPSSARDERAIETIRPAVSLALDAIGKPGERAFFLQATGDTDLTRQPVTFALEKTQALLLAEQIASFLNDPAPEAGSPVPLTPPERILFRAGRFALQYESQYESADHPAVDPRVELSIEEMLGEGQGTPRRVVVSATRAQLAALAAQAREVVSRGRQAL